MKKYLPYFFRFAIPLILLWSFQSKAQGTETFESEAVLTPSYGNGTFTSETPGVTVNFMQARNSGIGTSTDNSISGKGIILRRELSLGLVEFVIPNGVGIFRFNYRKAFASSAARSMAVFVDDIQAGVTPAFGVGPTEQPEVYEFSQVIDKPGPTTVKISYPTGTLTSASSPLQVTIDNVSWTGFSGTPQPNIIIEGSNNIISPGSTLPTTSNGTDFGTLIGGVAVERTFSIRNTGAAPLILGSPAVTLLSGSSGFVISAQPTDEVSAFGSQNFKIIFSHTGPATYTEMVQVQSNDPDMPVYTFMVKAVVLEPVINVSESAISGFVYSLSQGPSPLQSFVVNASNLWGNIAVTVSSNWEISTNRSYDNSNVAPWTSLTLDKTQSGAVTNRTIHVRLKDGLPVGVYNGIVTLSSPSATSKTVNLSGQVAAGVAEIKVSGNGTRISNGSTLPSSLNNSLFATQNMGGFQTKPFEIRNVGGASLTINSIGLAGTHANAFNIINGPAAGTVLAPNQLVTFDIKFQPTTIGVKNATISINSSDPTNNPYVFAIRGGAVYCSSSGEIVVAQQNFEGGTSDNLLNYTVSDLGPLPVGTSSGLTAATSGNNGYPKNNNLFSEGKSAYRVQGADPAGEIASGSKITFDNVNTTFYTELALSLKIAGFSLGSISNGMDSKNTTGDPDIIPDYTKIDHVLVEISPDGGVTWYPQAKIVSDEMELAWSFGSAHTVQASRTYSEDNALTYFKSNSSARYSAITITNIPAVSQLKVRISLQNNAQNESWVIDDVKITSVGLVPKVWNGTSWFPSDPQPSDRAVVTGDYTVGQGNSFTACQCEVSSGATLTISEGAAVKVSDILINNGSIIVKSAGNLVQYNETDGNSGSGFFRAERTIRLSATRQQYNYLISPALSWSMKNIYKDSAGNPVTVPIVLYHNESTNTFADSSGAFIKGRALAVKEPTAGYSPQEITAVFEGKPSNGTFTYTLVNSNPANSKRGFNLIGNPYPSNIDLIKFYQNNSSSNKLSPTFYFWDNTVNTVTHQMGDSYTGQAYAIFNAATPPGQGTPILATGEMHLPGIKWPSRYVKVAQGFMVKLIGETQMTVNFSNDIRVPNDGEGFFGKNTDAPVDRYWLNMTNASGIASNIAIVYFPEGDDAYTMHDSQSMGGSDVLYSMVDGEKVSINGKNAFTTEDVVALGSSHFNSGNYTISLDRVEGIFTNAQKIFLKDNKNGVVSNLSEGSYTFAANEGQSEGRFEIVYAPRTVLAINPAARADLNVYRDGNDYVISAMSKKITHLEIFDAAGRLIYKIRPNGLQVVISGGKFLPGVYIIRIGQDGSMTSKKIVK